MSLFPVPEPPDHGDFCQWCGEPAVQRVEVTPAAWSSRTGVRLLKTHAIEADVCAKHAAMVQRSKDEAEAITQARRAARAQKGS